MSSSCARLASKMARAGGRQRCARGAFARARRGPSDAPYLREFCRGGLNTGREDFLSNGRETRRTKVSDLLTYFSGFSQAAKIYPK